MNYIIPFQDLKGSDKSFVGGKAYSLGVLIQNGVNVPPGFSITTKAYFQEIKNDNLNEKEAFKANLLKAFDELGYEKVAVRSSAIAEDSSIDSWAGQLESYLNVDREHLYEAVLKCWDSINSDRIKTYVKNKTVSDEDMAVGVAVQAMVDSQSSGVMFTKDPTGESDSILIEAGFGLGEAVVQALITPDKYLVDRDLQIIEKKIHSQKIQIIAINGISEEKQVDSEQAKKQKIEDSDIISLAKQALVIEKIYDQPMDTEWAKSEKGLFIVQARPITVIEHRADREYIAEQLAKELGQPILEGIGASGGVISGPASVIHSLEELNKVKEGDVLVTKTTTPDFVAVFDKIVAAVTDTGGLTSHTALVSRELGIPAVVGTDRSTTDIKNGTELTVDGYSGKVFIGKTKSSLEVSEKEEEFQPLESTRDDIEDFLNIITHSYNDVSELWPLSPVQLYGYLDVNLGLDMLNKFKMLVLEKHKSFDEIADMFDRADQIRLFLSGVTISGLKVAKRLGIATLDIEDQVNLTQWLLSTLKAKVEKDPLSLEGGHYSWTDGQANQFVINNSFSSNKDLIKASIKLNVALFNYIWAYYWDYFPDCGYETHGTYKVKNSKYAEAKGLVVRDYFDLIPKEVWGDISEFSDYKSISVSTLYDTRNIFFKFTGRILNKHSLVPHIKYVSIIADDKNIDDPSLILKITNKLNELSKAQIEIVNNMDKLDLVKRGDIMANYARKKFHEYFGEWYNPEPVNNTIEQLGRQFVDKFSNESNRDKQAMRNFYDPRNDFVPSLDS